MIDVPPLRTSLEMRELSQLVCSISYKPATQLHDNRLIRRVCAVACRLLPDAIETGETTNDHNRTPCRDRTGERFSMLNATLLSIVEEAGVAVMILTEDLEQEELLRSRLTRAEVQRQVRSMSDAAARLPADARKLLAEIDWDGWQAMAKQLKEGGPEADAALWFATRSLVPAILMWLRVYRQNQPELFVFAGPA
jgi:uncharacterized protein with HEPN domain